MVENRIGYGWNAGTRLISKLSEYGEFFILIQLHKLRMISEDARESLQPSETIKMLAGLFKDSDGDVKQSSIEAISALCQHGELLIPCYLHMLSMISEDVRANLEPSETITMLSGLFKDGNWHVRQASIEAISALCQHGELLIPY
jgi:hypothetical protein